MRPKSYSMISCVRGCCAVHEPSQKIIQTPCERVRVSLDLTRVPAGRKPADEMLLLTFA
jgi:hypothetical protein